MNSENNTRKRVPKPVKRRQNVKKIGSGFVLLILAVVLAIGGTLAFIIANTEEVKNEFTPGVVECVVDEKFENNVKSDVKIKNTGNTAAYIRATYVVTWKADNGTVNAKQPVEDTDYTIDVESAKERGWIPIDGYWYYTSLVNPKEATDVLIKYCALKDGVKAPEGYHLSVEIIASAIQSDPDTVVAEKWKVNVVDGKIAAKGA